MFGLLDDIDRQDVKNWLNSAVDNTADLYDTVTEYDYSNMFDDIGDYFRGLLSDEPASPLSSQMGSAFGSRGRGRPRPQAITKTTVSVSPGVQPMMMPQRIKDAEMRRRGAEDIRLQYPEFDMMMQMNPPRRPKLSDSDSIFKRSSTERKNLAKFARRNSGGMRDAPDYGSEETVVNPVGYKTLEQRDDAYPLSEYLKRRVRDQVRDDNRVSAAQAAADARIGNSVRQRYMPSINPAPNPFPLL